mmetsp:Transcript_88577/g.236757  ORF Transcript_88577/g.236757 Transcript_88577/m.236757 type:complete len:218 (-) Transcript_88577:268-921(-)
MASAAGIGGGPGRGAGPVSLGSASGMRSAAVRLSGFWAVGDGGPADAVVPSSESGAWAIIDPVCSRLPESAGAAWGASDTSETAQSATSRSGIGSSVCAESGTLPDCNTTFWNRGRSSSAGRTRALWIGPAPGGVAPSCGRPLGHAGAPCAGMSAQPTGLWVTGCASSASTFSKVSRSECADKLSPASNNSGSTFNSLTAICNVASISPPEASSAPR